MGKGAQRTGRCPVLLPSRFWPPVAQTEAAQPLRVGVIAADFEKRWNMADGAEVTLGWYDNSLTADEARVLRALDHQVVHVLYMNNVHVRPEWSSRTEHQERFIQCIIADPQPRVLLEVSSRE